MKNKGWEKRLRKLDEKYGLVDTYGGSETHLERKFNILIKWIAKEKQKSYEEIIELIKDCGPDMVVPIKELPYREDYINKWKLIKKLKEKK